MNSFEAVIDIIGINPFVFVPKRILQQVFKEAGKDKGPIPIEGTVNGKAFKQTLVKYRGDWRLYINTAMLNNSPKRIGERITITLSFDPVERTIVPHPKLLKALRSNAQARKVFEGLPASRQKEIVRYISFLKTEESIDKNVNKAIDFLLGNGKFVGRDRP
ncbi:MAG TPA: YdeI/OmpD-associated family protein [Flavipsychrobacter sp.]|nr:YdeI/OmpD-associated family protein [Flavipsychrobacter sp.]